ncbi:MAG TPA: endo alpha-1,4 polygalactosaminidase [Tepidisphaeraceae bacterium]|jgi:hypothetical protein|nr:endo alpha-1,4 polygalactosaminidase [Tepidisphaeraceae bacterium]
MRFRSFAANITTGLILTLTASSLAELHADPKGDTNDPTRDVTSIETTESDGRLTVKVTATGEGDFGTYLIFFDTDTKATTGFQPPAEPKFGFEMLVSGDQLLSHNGDTRDVWAWEPVSAVQRQVDGNTLVVTMDSSSLRSKSVDLAVWAMSADWMNRLDKAPDTKPIRVTLNPNAAPATKPTAEMAAPKENRHLSARARVKAAASYYCYYGSGKVEELSHYDVVVLHSPQMKPADIKRLNDAGVVTVGYISVGESEPPKPLEGDGTGPGGFASFYFDKDSDNKPDMNPIWLSYYTNANDPKWREDRVREARRLVNEDGYHGIFLDTIDTAMANPETAPGMVQLVQELRAALPDAPIVLNQGFPLLPLLAPIADALMLESYTATYDFDSKTYMMNYPQSIDHHLSRTQREILPVLEKHPLKVFVLDYAPEHEVERIQEAANRAATFGFLFAAAPISLDSVYANNIVGKPDRKWLKKMTTPELLALKLSQTANGFPVGTSIKPSSAYAGYKIDPIVDGVTDRTTLHWSKAAWASAEDEEPAWIEFQLPEPRKGGALHIDWEPSHPSRAFTVQVKQGADSTWRDTKRTTENDARVTKVELPSEPYQAIRIHQEPGEGSTNRPNLMWIAQVFLN